MDQYLLIPFLVGWTSIYQLFWCSPGVQGFDTLPCLTLCLGTVYTSQTPVAGKWWSTNGFRFFPRTFQSEMCGSDRTPPGARKKNQVACFECCLQYLFIHLSLSKDQGSPNPMVYHHFPHKNGRLGIHLLCCMPILDKPIYRGISIHASGFLDFPSSYPKTHLTFILHISGVGNCPNFGILDITL